MLSKFKKLFRLSKPPTPQKQKEEPTEGVLQTSPSNGDLTKKKEKGKRKNSHPSEVGDGVETQNQGPYVGEVEIVENEFRDETDEGEYDDLEEDNGEEGDAVVEDESDLDDSFLGGLMIEHEQTAKSFSCLSPIEIVEYQEKEVTDIADLLSVPTSISATLLRHFHWKREKLLTKYLENPQQACQSAGVPYVPTSGAKLRSLSNSGSKAAGPASCSICGDDELTSSNSSALTCNHTFCNECWGSHLCMKINEGEPEIHCPHYKCNIHVPDIFIKKLVPPPVFEKYLRFVTKNFVRENDKVVWCPTPGCPQAITFDQSSTNDSCVVECVCGYKFCFKCHHEAHAPATCEQMKMWDKEAEIFDWRAINCRECPKCNVSVEKNGGCNHMTCQQCKYEWCWVCMRAWRGHADFFNCDKAEKDVEKGKRKSKRKKLEEEREKKQVAMRRYLQYRERFEQFEELQKAEAELRVNVTAKIKQLQDAYTTKLEVQFIDKAVNELQECRSVLKFTWTFAYYAFPAADPAASPEASTPRKGAASSKDLFEMLQEELSKTADRLLEVVEGLLKRAEGEMMALKLDAINHTSLARTKRMNLLNALARDPLFEQSGLAD